MHPALLLLPFLASSSLLLPRRAHAAAGDCEPAACGRVTVKYPFWLGGRNASSSELGRLACGHPAFEVRCAGGGVASLRGTQIHVFRIDYGAGSFVASHTRVAAGDDGVCRTDFNMSSSLALSPFRISRSNRAMCVLYNCTGGAAAVLRPGFVNATSRCGGKPVFVYLDGTVYDRDNPPQIPTDGCTYSFLPVLGSTEAEAAAMTAANYSQLLKDGFVLEYWAGIGGDCAACNATGGQCRYDNGSLAFACLCPGGRQTSSTCSGESH